MRPLSDIIEWAATNRNLRRAPRPLLLTLAAALAVACGDATSPDDEPQPVPVVVARVDVSPAEHLLEVGGTVQLAAVARSAAGDSLGRTVTWAIVGDTAAARISASGVLTARGEGSVLASATVEGKTGSAAITIRPVNTPAPMPVLSSITPNSAVAGSAMAQTLKVVGTGFVLASTVRWNGEPLATQYVSATELRAAVEQRHIAQAGNVAVTVHTPAPGGGASAGATFVVRPADAPAPVPAIAELEPKQIPAGWGGSFTLTVTGTGFTMQSRILWNGQPRETVHINAGELRTTIAKAEVAYADTVAVTVYTPAPGGGLSQPAEFRILMRPVERVEVTSQVGAFWTWRDVTLPLRAVPYDITGAPAPAWGVTWSSGNEGVARVSATGVVTPVSVGIAAIRATSGGVTAERHVRVYETPDHALLYDAEDGGPRRVMLWTPGSFTGPLALTDGSANAWDPSPSPDGSRIALAMADAQGNYDIWVIDRNGANPRRLTTSAAYDAMPEWSPDGTRIAFVSSRDGWRDVWVMNADGSDQTRLTWDPGSDLWRVEHEANLRPAWTPDSKRIVFTSSATTGQHVWIMNADGSEKRRITEGSVEDEDPTVTPDGEYVTFRRTTASGTSMPTVLVADGTPAWNIMQPGPGRAPRYSPDGKWLLYDGVANGAASLYVMPANGSDVPRIVVSGAGGGANGAWIAR